MTKKHSFGKDVLVHSEEKKTGPLQSTDPLPLEQIQRKPEDIVLTDEAVKLTVKTLLIGKVFASSSFPIHTGLIILLCKDFREGQELLFLNHLKTYFIQAFSRVPQTPDRAYSERILARLQELIRLYGFQLVGKIILARMAA